jgi:hypothetical protein
VRRSEIRTGSRVACEDEVEDEDEGDNLGSCGSHALLASERNPF